MLAMNDDKANKPAKQASPLGLAVSLGVGLLPGPHGTYGSVLFAGLVWLWMGHAGAALCGVGYLAFTACFTLLAVWLTHLALARRVFGASHDPGRIVIDEAAGFLFAAYGVEPGQWPQFLAALAAFRLFDILKPFPVNVSQRLPGAWGVVVDDVLAGLYALGLVRLLGLFIDWNFLELSSPWLF